MTSDLLQSKPEVADIGWRGYGCRGLSPALQTPLRRLEFVRVFRCFLLIGLSGLTGENQGIGPLVFFAILTALSVFLVVRTFRMATVIADSNSILIRGFLRSRRVPIAIIRSVETLDQPNMYGMGGKTIVLKTVDGRTIKAGEFWATSRSGINRMDTLARELNTWCRSHRSEAC